MKVAALAISNFRGIKKAQLNFDGHTLLIGMNNVGKSTVCEALELVLGLDRVKRFPPVEEYDFYNACYLDKSTEPATPVPIEIEAILINLDEELATKCFDRLEYWDIQNKRLLAEGEIDSVDSVDIHECLRIKAVAHYNDLEDEFEAKVEFCSGPQKQDGGQQEVPRNIRQLFGFYYLRALRTGSRALSMERGTLLDTILQKQNIRTGIWENTIEVLKGLDPPIDEGSADLTPILNSIERRLEQYIPLAANGKVTQLYVSQLTREHLRKTISFFLRTSDEQNPVPFQLVGTGTINALVFALLSFITDIRSGNVIFAMEEPEIALPPHTQRRIVDYLLKNSTQCFITTHSPYVIDSFKPEQVRILRKNEVSILSATNLTVGKTLKDKTYRKHSRKGLAEAMLGKGVIVCEGITEKDIILAVSEKMEEYDSNLYYPLDLSGVSVFSADGDGSLPEFGSFFKSLGIMTYAFFDHKERTPEERKKLRDSFDILEETKYTGSEKLLIEETIPARQLELLLELHDSEERHEISIPSSDSIEEIKTLTKNILKNKKGSGYAGRLVEFCSFEELPISVVTFLTKVYGQFKKPDPIQNVANQVHEENAAQLSPKS